jgi:hypothetical protein
VDVEAGLLDELDEADEVVAVGEVVVPLHRLVAVPEDVGLDDVEAAVLGLLDQPRPHLRSIRRGSRDKKRSVSQSRKTHQEPAAGLRSAEASCIWGGDLGRAPGVVDGPGDEDAVAAVYDERAAVVRDGRVGRGGEQQGGCCQERGEQDASPPDEKRCRRGHGGCACPPHSFTLSSSPQLHPPAKQQWPATDSFARAS